MKRKQPFLPLSEFKKLGVKEFGGSLLKGNPKEARPLSTKKAIHLVLRSSVAKGKLSFLTANNMARIEKTIHSVAKKLGVKVYRYANSGNHLHLIILPSSRPAFNAYIRSVTGIIARIVTGRERGQGENAAVDSFWDARPFTRIIEWGREFKSVSQYLNLNILEAVGFAGLPMRTGFSSA